ncbi:hypothetical protein [Allobranchiibius huperziae]|uniref:hypothetical protein n=1 Tax=Allobranchiibius huperziae TaxID=1874116 RepID=UPI0015C7FD9D|nr:hypothetical protein [Allobranchiibius huperziae]
MQHMIGGLDATGHPVPLQRQHLMATASGWPVSASTPDDIAQQLRVARDLYTHCLLVWEFNAVGVAWSLMAVESALRWALIARESVPFKRLINDGLSEGMYDDRTAEQLHVGRELRNEFSHPKNQPAFSLGMAAPMLETSHRVVAVICDAVEARSAPVEGAT